MIFCNFTNCGAYFIVFFSAMTPYLLPGKMVNVVNVCCFNMK